MCQYHISTNSKSVLLYESRVMVFPTNTYASTVSNRLSGQDRYQTSRAISEQFNSGTVRDVIITSGNEFPAALSASVLAKKLNAPILLVDKNVQDSIISALKSICGE